MDAGEELRLENERLREELARLSERPPRPGGLWRTIVAAIVIVLGVVLAPAAVVANWAATEVSSTARFVESLRPLVHNAEVLDYLDDQLVQAIETNVDIDGLVAGAFDAVAESTGPRVDAALERLAPAAALGIRNLLTEAVTRITHSDQFRTVWDEALRLTHTEVIAILNDDRTGAVVIGGDGVVGVRLEPVLTRIKEELTKTGFPLAAQIPIVDSTIPLTTVEGIGPARTAYRTLLALAAVLPIASIALLAIGVAVARNRPRALVATGIGIAVTLTVVLVLLLTGRTVLQNQAGQLNVPRGVVGTMVDSLTLPLQSAGLAVVLLGLIIAGIGFWNGDSSQALAIRSVTRQQRDRAHAWLEAHGVAPAGVGTFFFTGRFVIRIVVALLAIVVLQFSRPLTPGTVILTALVSFLVLIVASLFEARQEEEPILV